MSSEIDKGGYLEPIECDLPRPEQLEEVESAKRYCLRNGLKTDKSGDVYTGVLDGERYLFRQDPNRWEVASHVVADAFLQQYDIESPDIDYVDGSLVMSSTGEPAVPVDSRRREFLLRDSFPNFLQPAKADPETVADSLFTPLAGGAADINGNTVLADGVAYPIDFQDLADYLVQTALEGLLTEKGSQSFWKEN